jgi:opacity protein-like surface antigen
MPAGAFMSRFMPSAFVLALLAGVSVAADLPAPFVPPRVVVPPPPALTAPTPVAFDWRGFYVGAHGGWGFGTGALSDGAMAGGHAGVNWQYGRFVVGFEGAGNWVDWSDVNLVETVLGRGGIAFGRFHAYGTGGIASKDGVALVGWAAGAGLEYALTGSWIVGAEYLHFDFADDDSEVVRGRVSYLFGSHSDGAPPAGIFDEVRAGVLGFWQENADSEEGVYLTAQVLFDPMLWPTGNRFLDIVLRPRPHVGGNVSPTGTDQLFAGLTWTVPLGRVFFAEASFGGTVHNGAIIGSDVSLGCHALFRESVGVGVNLGQHWRIVASADHSSHAGLCSEENDGLTHVGASVGYRF